MPDLAVVPIFVNAGAAVLPAIIGGAASALALLYRPRALLTLFRRRPWIFAVLVAVIVVGWLGVRWILATTNHPAPQATRSQQPTDWAEIGRQIVRARQYAAQATTLPATAATVAGDLIVGLSPQRTGFDGGIEPIGLAAEALWSHAEEETFYLSTPIVKNGRVYGAACQIDVVDKFGYVFAADARTGKLLWKTTALPAGSPFKAFFSSPALSKDGRSLIIGQGLHEHADCALICLDTETGAIRWLCPTPLHLESSPAVRGDLVVIGAGAIEDGNRRPTGDPGFVLAVDLATGKERWRYPLADPESSPAIDDAGIVYIGSGFNGNAVVALRSESDEELKSRGLDRLLWKTATAYPVVGPVTLAGDLVIVGGGNSDFVNADPRPAGVVMALNRKTGEVRWNRDMGDSVLGSIACHDGKLICPIRNGHVALLNATTGAEIWRVKVGEGSAILAGCAVTPSRIYVVNKIGQLHALKLSDGTPAQLPLNVNGRPGESGYCLSAPIIAEGRLYIGSETGGLRCFVGEQ